jgi:putative ABC transport system permease protein
MIDTLLQDLRYAARTLAKRPGPALVILVTLALGTGANSAIFSVVNAVLLKPLPFADPDRLVALYETLPDEGRIPVGYRTYAEWRAQCGAAFDGVAAFSNTTYNLEGGDEPERVKATFVTPDYFELVGARPLIGRGFTQDEARAGGPKVAIIGHGLWRRRFAGSPSAVGKSLRLDAVDYEIVGVMPEGEEHERTGWSELWIPMAPRDEARALANPFRYMWVTARLREGVTIEQARAETDRVMRLLRQSYPDTHGKPYGTDVLALEDVVVPRRTRAALLVLLGVVGCVLLVACANVANLQLARAASREREIAVRSALGASRARVARQLLTESLLLSFVGACGGLLLAQLGIRLLLVASPDSLPRAGGVRLDPAVFVFAFALAALTGIAFGLAPALVATKVDLNAALKEGARGAGAGRGAGRLRALLVAAEVAVALALLTCSGLMLRSHLRLGAVPAGFDTERVLVAEVDLPARRYDTRERRVQFFREMVERARSLPGVEAAAAAESVPLRGPTYVDPVIVEGRPLQPRGQIPFVRQNIVTPDYFRAMGIRLASGRPFTEQETWETGGAIMVNETFARKFFPGEEPLGRRIKLAEEKPWMTVVGVVADHAQDSFDSEKTFEEMFFPYTNTSDPLPITFMSLVLRTSADPAQLAAPLRAELRRVDPSLPLARVETTRAIAARALSGSRFQTLLTGLFAALALVLAAVGVYGVVSYTVAQRAHEIGVRVALGARTRDVLRLVVGQGMRPVLFGVVAGLAASFALTRLLEGLLFGVSATDPATFAATAAVLAAVALAACLLPALRATRVDPAAALKHE